MDEAELLRRLRASAPPSPAVGSRGRVLASVATELRRPAPALDRILSHRPPWIVAALLLTALGAGVLAQEASSSRKRAERGAERRSGAPDVSSPRKGTVHELAGMDTRPRSSGEPLPSTPPASAPVYGPWGVRRWLESPEGRELR